jgi:hypothetical protein
MSPGTLASADSDTTNTDDSAAAALGAWYRRG